MSFPADGNASKIKSIYDSPTFDQDFRIHVNEAVGSASIAPNGRDVVLASQHGLHIIDLDAPYSPPRHLRHETPWTPADVQWSPFAARYYWVVSTSNQRALVWNLELGSSQAPIEHILHAHTRTITDINFSAHHPDILATCAVDSFVHCWDLRTPARPAVSFSDWYAGATQVKWNRQDSHIIASSHDKFLRIWDDRKGAIPVATIEAHATKIYGVDWNRTERTKIITCSLDRTIKMWDYSTSDVLPERIIQTPFPVWRARHTPFGCGLLAMPQRGDHSLHMYDRRSDDATLGNAETKPSYSFTGHQDQVREFLWRARGTIDNHVDERDFQLVSWGADRELILHRMSKRQLKPVGFEKGMHIDDDWPLTRRGAPYKSFRNQPIVPPVGFLEAAAAAPINPQSLDNVSTSPGMNRAPIPVARDWISGGPMMTYSGLQTRNVKQRDNSLITWMKGVKFGKRGMSMSDKRRSRPSIFADSRTADFRNLPENLSDEIIHVGDTFKRVTFEKADVSLRRATVSLNGPWGIQGKAVFVKLRVHFPQDYPEASPPRFHLERLSSTTDEKLAQLEDDLHTIAEAYLVYQRGCLEAALSFLLGEHDLLQSTSWLAGDAGDDESAVESDERQDSSSDEDDGLDDFATAQSQTLDRESATASGILGSNANAPLPKACGALWAPNGQLVCFFPPKDEPVSLLDSVALREGRALRTRGLFEGFGRLHADSPSPEPKHRSNDTNVLGDESDDYDSSSSSSSSSSTGANLYQGRFFPPKAWRGASLRFRHGRSTAQSTEGSLRANGFAGRKTAVVKTIVSLYDCDDVLPAKRVLAEEYIMFGDGPSVCLHNAEVASKHGYDHLADVWGLLRLILCNDVPLSLMQPLHQMEHIYVVARRALVRIKRKDSGLDLSFDEPEAIQNPILTAHVKWGHHPFGGSWIANLLFEHFEKDADVQMLAMLSCIFAEPAQSDAPRSTYTQFPFPSSMRFPAQSADYMPSEVVALSTAKPLISISSSPKVTQTPATTFGSATSSDGFRDFNYPTSEPMTPFSTNSPPLALSRASTQRSTAVQSLSASPEHRMTISSGASSFAASVWSRPFQLAGSPPQRTRVSGEDHLSTSIPSSSSVTWGRNTVHASNATIRRSYMAQQLADNNEDGSSTEEDEPALQDTSVKVSLKNQRMFDDEAHASVPFLQPHESDKFSAYREAYADLLDVWGLQIQRHEMLKFSGMSTDTTARKPSDVGSQTTLTLGRSETTDSSAVVQEGLGVSRRCTTCGYADIEARSGARCSRCGSSLRILPCSVCHEPVLALYKACLDCEHTAHLSCLRALLNDVSEDEIECEAGCGCRCRDHSSVDLRTRS